MSASEQALHDFWRSRPSLMSASVSKRFLSSSTSALLRKLIGYVSMKPKLALWTLLLFVPAARAAAITCNAGAASIPVFNPTSVLGAVGDYTLDCTGGMPGTPIVLNFISFMNVSVLNTGGWILTDGVHNFAGTLVPSNVVEFLGVTVNPPGGAHLDLQVENIFVNPSILPPGSEFLEDMAVSDPSIGIVNSVQVVAENAPEPSTLPLIGWALGALTWLWRCRWRSGGPTAG